MDPLACGAIRNPYCTAEASAPGVLSMMKEAISVAVAHRDCATQSA
jgi:hypothetical protein